jgi:hypothetical protein
MDELAKKYVEGDENAKIEIEAEIKNEEIEQFLSIVISKETNQARKSQLERKLAEKA